MYFYNIMSFTTDLIIDFSKTYTYTYIATLMISLSLIIFVVM